MEFLTNLSENHRFFMIHPLGTFAVRGAIWYQGEANLGDGMLYAERMKGLINGWRQIWGEDLSFYYVQIAPYNYGGNPQTEARLWEAQAAVMDREDAKDLINSCIDAAGIDVKATRFPKAEVVADILSLSLNREQSIQETVRTQYDYFSSLTPQLNDLANRYSERKRACNSMPEGPL